jgi:hypothetical protein
VQVSAIGRKGAGQAEDLQIAADGGGLSSPPITQLGNRETSYGADYAARLLLLLAHPGFQCLHESASGRRRAMPLHGEEGSSSGS